jgi:NADH dehydrogenase/NADH:ubiquinone oxidoreductase subunit G
MNTVAFTIDGKEVSAPQGESLLKAARASGFEIPSLCYHEAVTPYGGCRLCLVEVTKGRRTRLTTSCNYPVLEGIRVVTDSEKIRRHRRLVAELLLARAPASRRIRELAASMGVDRPRFGGDTDEDCILCGLCTRVCAEVVGANAIGLYGRGRTRRVGPPFGDDAKDCIACGACVYVCPTDCIKLSEEVERRRIVRWGRDLEMQKCGKCGYPFAPKFQLEYFKKLAYLPGDFYDLCQDCRKSTMR